jgi:hypothetical protein
MDTTNFTETQLDVREAISKICSRFPDVMAISSYWSSNDIDGIPIIGILGREG